MSLCVYPSAECLVRQVSERFAGSTAESRTGEHADAGIHLLMGVKDIIFTFNMSEKKTWIYESKGL